MQGRLLALALPCEVRPDAASASRSQATGRLAVTMPKEDRGALLDITCLRPAPGQKARGGKAAGGGGGENGSGSSMPSLVGAGSKQGMQRAAVAAAAGEGEEGDELPPL